MIKTWPELFNRLKPNQKVIYFEYHGIGDDNVESLQAKGFKLEDTVRVKVLELTGWPDVAKTDSSGHVRMCYYSHYGWPIDAKLDSSHYIRSTYYAINNWPEEALQDEHETVRDMYTSFHKRMK